jgi:hypothetical protein
LARALSEAGREASVDGDAVLLPSGLRLEAALADNGDPNAGDLGDGRVLVSIRILAIHDKLFPEGLPEVLHAAGATAAEAVAAGLAAWARRALPVLEDALRPAVQDCDLMNMTIPTGTIPTGKIPGGKSATHGDGKEGVYQALFGPVIRIVDPAQAQDEEEPCSFCMATRAQDALAGRLRANGYSGVRLLAGRDAEGYVVADCEVNGEAVPEAAARLMAYAQSWPGRGFEVREQYVILRPVRAL